MTQPKRQSLCRAPAPTKSVPPTPPDAPDLPELFEGQPAPVVNAPQSISLATSISFCGTLHIAMSSSSCASGATSTTASVSSRHTASCGLPNSAMASFPHAPRALLGNASALPAPVASLPGSGIPSCSLPAAPSALAVARSSVSVPAARSPYSHPSPAPTAIGVAFPAVSAAAPVFSSAAVAAAAAAPTPASHMLSPQIATAELISTLAAASLHHPRLVCTSNTRVDERAQMQKLQQRKLGNGAQLLPPQASNVKPGPKRCPTRLGHAAAAMAAVILACSVAGAAAQHVAASNSLGSWSAAALSVARYYLAATSLPDAGVAIFAGGQDSTCCDVCFEDVRDGAWVRGGDA